MTPNAGARQQRLGLVDQAEIPARNILLGERHIVAACIARRAAPRFGKQHQRQKPERLRLVRHQFGRQPPEPDALIGEVAAARLRAGRVGPALGEGGVDRLQHGAEPLAEIRALRHAERDARLADASFWRAPDAGPSSPATPGRPRRSRRRRSPESSAGSAARGCRPRSPGARRQTSAAAARRADRHRHAGLHLLGDQLEMIPRGCTRLPPPDRIDAAPRATASSHASGFCGTPPAGQRSRAAAKASARASSAPATSRVRAAR